MSILSGFVYEVYAVYIYGENRENPPTTNDDSA